MNFVNWSVLGIEPTRDKKAITAAYRARVVQVNPEDKPEEFMALRAAYEEAMKLADQAEEAPAREKTPVERWIDRVRGLYDDFAARIRPENWEALVQEDVCAALDTRHLAEEALLKFFLEDYFIPQSCWQVLDRAFSWSDRRKELYERYPRDFVDYAVMNGVRLPATLPYELFIPGKNGADCDQYRRLYYQANRLEDSELGPILQQMMALSEWHPYGEALRCVLQVRTGEEEKGMDGFRHLAEAYPDDGHLNLNWAFQCARSGRWADSAGVCRHVLELEPDHRQAKLLLAESLSRLDQPEEAKQLLFDLVHASGGDRKKAQELHQMAQKLNETIIQQREPLYRENPTDTDNALKLGWCYLQNDREADALEICRSVDPKQADPYDYHSLYAKTAYSMGNYKTAGQHLTKVEEYLRALRPDGTYETQRRIERLPEILQLQGGCLMAQGNGKGALEKSEQAMALAPRDPEILTQTALLLSSFREHGRAAEILEKVTQLLPNGYHGYYYLAMSLYELGRDRDAFGAVNRAMELERGDLGVYITKMRILLRNGVWEGVRQILDFLYQNGVSDDLGVLWCEAQLTEYQQKDYDKALAQYREITRRLEKGEKLPWDAQVYYRINVIMARDLDMRRAEDRVTLMEVLRKGLACDPEDYDCLEYMAWILKRHDRTEEALRLYHKLEKVPSHNLPVERELAELYYRNLTANAEKALHYYQILLDREENPVLHFYAGTCLRFLGRWEEAEKHYLREREMDPEDVDAYNGLGIVYEALGRMEEALENADQAILLRKDQQGNQSRFYLRKVQILRRLGRPAEAAAVVDELTEKYGFDSWEQMKFDIFCQFGMWEEARQHLEVWKKNRKKPRRLAAARITLDMLTGEIDRAREALKQGEKKLNKGDYDRLMLQMANLDGDTDYMLPVWQAKAKGREENTHELINIAQILWSAGRIPEAKEWAAQALEKLDEIVLTNKRWEALYRGRRALMLAMVGRLAEAKQELELVRSLPLCDFCAYGKCKDADHFEAFIEEICEHYENACHLHRTAGERWPDEVDFISGQRRMQRKGYGL